VHEDFPASANGRSAANAHGESVLLTVDNVKLHYPILKGMLRRRVGTVQAVDGVSLSIHRGETLGIVGESGCGKTSLGRMLPRLVELTAGRIRFAFEEDLRDITEIPQARMKQVRRAMGMVFQDPMSSLNPRMNVRTIVSEPLILHDLARGKHLGDRAGELLEMVGLQAEHQNRFPHAFSGGQRQRIAIARALATQPKFVVADEPVSSLDVSVQAQILNLLMDLQRKLELSMLFIAHDIAVVRHMSDRIAVMYLGRIVETGMAHEVCAKPAHPYTEALLASIPHPIPGYNRAKNIPQGDLPDPANPPKGCRFHTRCPYAEELCRREDPMLRLQTGSLSHSAACHFTDKLELRGVMEFAPTKTTEQLIGGAGV
jgi:peptide/nickel transport system ATP-binding protein